MDVRVVSHDGWLFLFSFFFGEVFMLAFLLNKKAPRSLIAGEGSKSLVWLFAT